MEVVNNKKVRNSNYELMRIVSMFLIVLYHTIHHGMTIDLAVNPNTKVILELLRLVTIVHVNSFILITGFYQSESRFRLSKIIDLMLLSLFYKVVIMIVFSHFDIINLSKVQIIKELFPLEIVHSWYFKYYIILYFLSPFINKGINALNKKSYNNLLIILIVFFSIIPMLTNGVGLENSGFTLYQFVFMYIIGAYIRKFFLKENKISKSKLMILLIFIFTMCIILNYGIYKYSFLYESNDTILGELLLNYRKYYLFYSNILIVVQSISYFLFFGLFSFNSKIINHISKMMFGIYLLHDNNYVRMNIYNWLEINNDLIYSFRYFLYVIYIAFLIFVFSYLIESIRFYICCGIKKLKFIKKIREKIDKYNLCE